MTFYFKYLPVKKLWFLIICLSVAVSKAQVYNYDPFRYTNFETNPAFLASPKIKQAFTYQHNGTIPSGNNFYSGEFKFSRYNPGSFTGLGLLAGMLQQNDSVNYLYTGIGAAYRTILFNKIYTRIGIIGKEFLINSKPGYFSYYNFVEQKDSQRSADYFFTTNSSISFSSVSDKYYLSFSVLNTRFSVNNNFNYFPTYYVLTAGDFGKMLNQPNLEISCALFLEKLAETGQLIQGYSFNCLQTTHITRYSSVRWGGRIGFEKNSELKINPSLGLIKRLRSRKFVSTQVILDWAYNTTNNKQVYKPSPILNLFYFL